MKFLVAKLEANGATALAAERGVIRVRTRSGLHIPLNACPDPHEPTSLTTMAVPRWAVDHAISAIVTLDHEREQIRKNSHLSDEGRRAQFVTPRTLAVRMISLVAGTLADHESKVLKREAERYVVPAIGAQSFNEALGDFRIQMRLDSLRGDDRAAVRRRLSNGEDVNLLLATLRDKMPAPDLHEIATAAWRDLRDRTDPAGRAELDLALASIEWGKQSLGHVAGSVRFVLNVENKTEPNYEPLDHAGLYELARDGSGTDKLSAGAALFGFNEHDAARHELLIQRRAAA